MRSRLLRGIRFSGLAILATAGACDIELGARSDLPARTLGEVVYTETCNRVAYTGELDEMALGKRTAIDASGVQYRGVCRLGGPPPSGAPQVLGAVLSERQVLIGAVDAAAPAKLADSLDGALQKMMPALDTGEGAAAAVSTGRALLRLSADAEAVAGVGRLGWRDGFRPAATEAAFPRALLDDPELYPTLIATLGALWPAVPGGGDAPAAPARKALLDAIGREMQATVAVGNVAAPDRTLRLGLRLLFTENAELRTLPTGQGFWAVLRDARGLAEVNRPAGVLPAQFVDADKDGAADVDGRGRFLARGGGLLPAVTPFPSSDAEKKDAAAARDASGKALVAAGGAELYRYVNLDDTVLAGLLRELPQLLDEGRDIPLRYLRGAGHLLGPRLALSKAFPAEAGGPLRYSGFDTTKAPLLDLVYGFVQLLGYTNTGDGSGVDAGRFLRGLSQLFQTSENAVARSFLAIARAFDEAKKPAYAQVQLAEESTLYDDLAPVLVRMLRQPALVVDLLDAVRQPEAADLGQIIGLLVSDRGLYFMNQDQPDWRKPGAVLGSFKPIDRSAPDSDVTKDPSDARNNRSALQRVLHLVHDASELSFCNKEGAKVNFDLFGIKIKIAGPAPACGLFELDDLATYFLLSMADVSVKQRDPYTNFLNAILDGTLKNGALTLDLLGVLDSLFGIPGFTKYPTPQELARVLFQDNAKRADFFKDALDFGACAPQRPGTLCSNRNLAWQSYYDGGLFALEMVHPRDASGNLKTGVNFYTAIKPIVNAFARYDECVAYSAGTCVKKRNAAKILVDLLAVLHRHWPTVKSQFFDQGYEAQVQAMKVRSGLSRYEPLLAAQLGQGDLWASSQGLADAILRILISDGSGKSLATETAQFVRWFMDPEAPRIGGALAFRDGRTLAQRSDGLPTFRPTGDPIIKDVLTEGAQGKVTPYDLLAEAFRRKRARLAESPERQAEWQGSVSALADLYLTSQLSGGQWKYASPRFRALVLGTLDHLRERVLSHGAAMDLGAWLSKPGGLYGNLAESLSGPVFAGLVDTLSGIYEVAEARRGLPRLLTALVKDPGSAGTKDERARFQAVLSGLADSLQLLLDDGDVVPILRSLGSAVGGGLPNAAGSENAADVAGLDGATAASTLDGALAVARRALPLDEERVLQSLGQNLLRSDASGRYPAAQLGDVIAEINRQNAGAPGLRGTDLADADIKAIAKTLGSFLTDHQRGLPRLLDIIRGRSGG